MPLRADPLWQFQLAMQPHGDAVLQTLFPGCCIVRTPVDAQGRPDALDQLFGIDLEITTAQGVCLTCQEKYREFRWLELDQFTLELFNDPERRTAGEWCNLQADLYFHAYATQAKDGLADWRLFKVVDLKLGIAAGTVPFGAAIPNRKHSGAWFAPLAWSHLPEGALVAACPEPQRWPWARR